MDIERWKRNDERGKFIRNVLFGVQMGFLVLKFTFLSYIPWKLVFLPLFVYVGLLILGFSLIGFICTLGMKKLIKDSERRTENGIKEMFEKENN